MPSTDQARGLLRLGEFELDVQSGELHKERLTIRLPDQPFQVLLLLLERAGAVVTREELQKKLWAADTFVDFDIGLNSVIRKLRETLGDSAEHPRFIETLPKRGYRLIASVKPAIPDQIPQPGAGVTATAGSRVRLPWIAGGLVLAAAIGTMALALERGWWARLRTGAASPQIRSLAVMPFENLTADSAQDYFVDGMTDALTTNLAQVGGLQVISRTSAMRYRPGARKPLPAIGKELNVDAVVEGAIVRSGQHVRITAQLIHAATDRHLWAQSYEGELSDVLTLQQQIAREITTAIGGRLAAPPARAGGPRTVNPQAYDAYLKGLAAGGRGTYDGFRNAVAYFEDAVARQPDFAWAHAALAQAQHQLLFAGPLSPRETTPKAEAAARKALQLDETVAQAHRTLGSILHNFYWQWEEGDKEFRRARELDANSAETRATGVTALIRSGRVAEAVAESERARRLDPRSFNGYINLAAAYRAAGQYDRAIAEFRRALEIIAGAPRAHFELGVTFIMMGRSSEAIGELETAVKSAQGGNARLQAYLGYAYAAAGRPRDARRILKALELRAREQYVSSFGIALVYDALGEKEPALAAFERAYQDRAVEFAQVAYPPFKTIASDPRFRETMRLIGLPR